MKRPAIWIIPAILVLSALVLTRALAQAPPPANEWTKYAGNPVVRPGFTGAWDSGAVFAPAVLSRGTDLEMWYTGNLATMTAVVAPAIGYASSNSSEEAGWVKTGDQPVLEGGPPTTWDAEGVEAPAVVRQGGTYHLWYAGRNEAGLAQIGHATSEDGLNWVKDDDNPVLKPGSTGSWDSQGVSPGSALWADGRYAMWYTGTNITGTVLIGLATSPDGVQWTKRSDPVFYPLAPGDWDGYGVYRPAVVFDGEVYRMWYSGVNAEGNSGVGYATSTDGIHWTRETDVPVLASGSVGDWDAAEADAPTVIYDSTARQYRMWYVGRPEAGRRQIGYAVASAGYVAYLPLVRR